PAAGYSEFRAEDDRGQETFGDRLLRVGGESMSTRPAPTGLASSAANQRDSLPMQAGSDRQGQQSLWDRWWYDRFEIPNDLPPEVRRCSVAVEGQTWTLALLDHVAPRTCQAFLEL